MRSLFLLPEVREAIRQTLELDPRLPAAYALAGNVDYEVPGIFGGSLERAEGHFRKGLGVDPRFTALRIGLAKVLRKQGRAAEARRELEGGARRDRPDEPRRVVDEGRSRGPRAPGRARRLRAAGGSRHSPAPGAGAGRHAAGARSGDPGAGGDDEEVEQRPARGLGAATVAAPALRRRRGIVGRSAPLADPPVPDHVDSLRREGRSQRREAVDGPRSHDDERSGL